MRNVSEWLDSLRFASIARVSSVTDAPGWDLMAVISVGDVLYTSRMVPHRVIRVFAASPSYYSNIRLTLLPNLKAYHVTWTGDRDGTSSRNVDTAQAEQWVRERIWILKHPARIALPAGV